MGYTTTDPESDEQPPAALPMVAGPVGLGRRSASEGARVSRVTSENVSAHPPGSNEGSGPRSSRNSQAVGSGRNIRDLSRNRRRVADLPYQRGESPPGLFQAGDSQDQFGRGRSGAADAAKGFPADLYPALPAAVPVSSAPVPLIPSISVGSNAWVVPQAQEILKNSGFPKPMSFDDSVSEIDRILAGVSAANSSSSSISPELFRFGESWTNPSSAQSLGKALGDLPASATAPSGASSVPSTSAIPLPQLSLADQGTPGKRDSSEVSEVDGLEEGTVPFSRVNLAIWHWTCLPDQPLRRTGELRALDPGVSSLLRGLASCWPLSTCQPRQR